MTTPFLSPSWRASVALVALVAAACARGDRDVIEGVGTLELDEADVAPLTAAQVASLHAWEGDWVQAGDTLAVLHLPGTEAQVEASRAQALAAEAAAEDVAAGARAPELERLAAELRAAEVEATRLARDAERVAALHRAGAVSAQEAEQARTAADVAARRRDAAQETLRLAREGAREGERRVARARAEAARAAARSVEATAGALVLVAPVTGRVVGRHAEPGEVLAPGEPVFTVADPRRPWTRVYVSQRVLPFVRVGGRATARLDALPDRAFTGRVVHVADRAEFTPRVALTERERDDLLFGVKVVFDDTTGLLKAGLPVTVRVER